MLTAALFSLGIAAFIVAASVCLSIGRLLKANHTATLDKEKKLWEEKTTWSDMKATFLVWSMRCQEKEAANRRKVLSWARTSLFCSGLCFVGAWFQVEFDDTISIPQIVAHIKHPRAARALLNCRQQTPNTSTSTPAKPHETQGKARTMLGD